MPPAGYSQTIGAGAMHTPSVISSMMAGGPIRSITIANQTLNVTANLYLARSPVGNPIYTFAPGKLITLPLMASDAIVLTFTASSMPYVGSIYLHADTFPLSASGFVV